MIVELLLAVFFGLSHIVLGLLSTLVGTVAPLPHEWGVFLVDLLKTGMYFIPPDIVAVCAAYFLGWFSVNLLWGVINWVIKKIPGIS